MIRLLTLPAGFILDLLMGDPRWLYPGMSHRKSDQHTGKRNTKGVSENR